jgi:hypothetical protein
MHYMTCISHQMKEHKFGVMSHGALFMESALGPSEHKK